VTVTVKLYGVFRIGRSREEACEVPPGSTPRTVLEQLRLPGKLLGTVLIEGVHAGIDDPLADGAVLSFLPILGGG
jgi:molybdopterin converting factor small subunit